MTSTFALSTIYAFVLLSMVLSVYSPMHTRQLLVPAYYWNKIIEMVYSNAVTCSAERNIPCAAHEIHKHCTIPCALLDMLVRSRHDLLPRSHTSHRTPAASEMAMRCGATCRYSGGLPTEEKTGMCHSAVWRPPRWQASSRQARSQAPTTDTAAHIARG